MNALVAPATITNSLNVNRAEDGFESTALQAAVREQGERFTVNNGQSRTDVTSAAKIHVGLQEKTLDFATLGVLLLFDQMER